MLTVRNIEYDGRLRKYYHITAEGLRRLETFRDEWDKIMIIYQFIAREDKK